MQMHNMSCTYYSHTVFFIQYNSKLTFLAAQLTNHILSSTKHFDLSLVSIQHFIADVLLQPSIRSCRTDRGNLQAVQNKMSPFSGSLSTWICSSDRFDPARCNTTQVLSTYTFAIFASSIFLVLRGFARM